MSSTLQKPNEAALKLVPRLTSQGYSQESIDERRQWIEEQSGSDLPHVGSYSIDSRQMKGNIENPIGVAQIPLGVAGPLLVNGQHAVGEFYVPLATTEGALVLSYERGAMAISRAGGATVRVSRDGNCCSPIFTLADVNAAHLFANNVQDRFSQLKEIAESTTSHGKLERIECRQIGRDVVIDLNYFTGDAHGMNMTSNATEAICQWLVEHFAAEEFAVEKYYVLSGGSSEKRASGAAFRIGKGKHVVAGVTIPAKIVRRHLHTTPEKICHLWQRTIIAQLQAGALGYNGHFANGLTAIFIACGQDVANVTNSAVGITTFETSGRGDLIASVTLPALTVATVGGGTGWGTNLECLQMLGCAGAGKALKFAEIVAATILAGELSFGSALTSGEFVKAHQSYGRNRPEA